MVSFRPFGPARRPSHQIQNCGVARHTCCTERASGDVTLRRCSPERVGRWWPGRGTAREPTHAMLAGRKGKRGEKVKTKPSNKKDATATRQRRRPSGGRRSTAVDHVQQSSRWAGGAGLLSPARSKPEDSQGREEMVSDLVPILIFDVERLSVIGKRTC